MVVLDMYLPGISGGQLADALRARWADVTRIGSWAPLSAQALRPEGVCWTAFAAG
ncbi:MAG: hypothetical protein ACHQ7M_07510 [Chloroflexota bacterium]